MVNHDALWCTCRCNAQKFIQKNIEMNLAKCTSNFSSGPNLKRVYQDRWSFLYLSPTSTERVVCQGTHDSKAHSACGRIQTTSDPNPHHGKNLQSPHPSAGMVSTQREFSRADPSLYKAFWKTVAIFHDWSWFLLAWLYPGNSTFSTSRLQQFLFETTKMLHLQRAKLGTAHLPLNEMFQVTLAHLLGSWKFKSSHLRFDMSFVIP